MKNTILTLPENTKGRDFVVGDIHGAFDLLDQALAAAKFDPEKDRLISVGDLIDRGPHSARCLEFLKQPWFFTIRGNHEDLFLETYKDGEIDFAKAAFNIRNGMAWIFSADVKTLEALRTAFEELPLAIEIPTARGTVGFVHAEVPAGLDWETFRQKLESGDKTTITTALWGRSRVESKDENGVEGVGRVFFGHTPQKGGAKHLGNCYYVDTGAVYRLLKGEQAEEYSLTLADITGKTSTFNKAADKNIVQLKTDVPKKHIPFGNHTKKNKP